MFLKLKYLVEQNKKKAKKKKRTLNLTWWGDTALISKLQSYFSTEDCSYEEHENKLDHLTLV